MGRLRLLLLRVGNWVNSLYGIANRRPERDPEIDYRALREWLTAEYIVNGYEPHTAALMADIDCEMRYRDAKSRKS